MGDRANIKLKWRDKNIYVYTHWDGHEWPERLQVAMRDGKERWNDPQYLQRFIITSMCPHDASDPTGYGVSVTRGDNSHDVLEVEFGAKKVRKLSHVGWHERENEWENLPPEVLQEWTFDEFIEADFAEPDEETE